MKKYSPVRRQQPLDRAGGAVARRPRSVDGDLADALAQRLVDGGRRRLLDELLVAPLDRAVPLAEEEHGPVGVGEDLRLDVPRALEVALDVDGVVGEELQPLALRGLEGGRRPGRLGHELHPLAAAAGGCLDDQRVADLLADLEHALDRARPDRWRRG